MDVISAETAQLLRSLRRWLQVAVFLLGVCLLQLVAIEDASTYGPVSGVIPAIGVVVTLAAGMSVLRSFT